MSMESDEQWEKIWKSGELGKREYDLSSFDESGVAEYLVRVWGMKREDAAKYVQKSFSDTDQMVKANNMKIPDKYRAYLALYDFESEAGSALLLKSSLNAEDAL